jgi:hypothetical protein
MLLRYKQHKLSAKKQLYFCAENVVEIGHRLADLLRNIDERVSREKRQGVQGDHHELLRRVARQNLDASLSHLVEISLTLDCMRNQGTPTEGEGSVRLSPLLR